MCDMKYSTMDSSVSQTYLTKKLILFLILVKYIFYDFFIE